MKKYDIFISYRRDGGAQTAKHLRDMLSAKGYRVFFDTDSLRSGDFNKELLRVIEECRDFIIILSQGALDRCQNEDDWVRQELAYALEKGKNVIPVIGAGFAFPERLPEEIDAIRWKSGITASVEYFDALVDKLSTFLSSNPKKIFLRRRVLPAVGIMLGVCLAAFGLWQAVSGWMSGGSFPANAKDRDILEESIGYVVTNAAHLNSAYSYYDGVLDDALAYCNQKANAPTGERLLEEITYYQKKIDAQHDAVEDLGAALSEKLTGTPAIKTSEMSAYASTLRTLINSMSEELDHLYLRFSEFISMNDTNAGIVEILREMSELEEEYCFLCLNEMFVNVNPEAMKQMITENLPLLPKLYRSRFVWTDDEATLKSHEDAVWSQIQNAQGKYASLVGDLRQDTDRMKSELARTQAILDTITPSEEDDFVSLWVDMRMALGYGWPRLARDCVDALEKASVEDYEISSARTARLWLDWGAGHGYGEGCVILYFDDEAEHPTLRQGDIITALNGQPVDSTQTLTSLKQASGADRWQYSILRSGADGTLEELTVPVSSQDPRLAALSIGPTTFDS